MNPVVHFEMPYEDNHRLAQFYQQAFGWKISPLGEEMGHYVLAYTAETDENNRVKSPGVINGGFFPKNQDRPSQHTSVVIAVENIGEAMKKIEASGGKVLGEPMDMPGVGKFVSIQDTEGNQVGILQPLDQSGCGA